MIALQIAEAEAEVQRVRAAQLERVLAEIQSEFEEHRVDTEHNYNKQVQSPIL